MFSICLCLKGVETEKTGTARVWFLATEELHKHNVSFLKGCKDVIELLEPTIIKRLTKEKRGQGSGKDYKPFLTYMRVYRHHYR